MKTLTLTLSDRTPASYSPHYHFPHTPHPPHYHSPHPYHSTRSHPYHYSHATLSSLPPRFHIEHHPVLGYRAHFTPLTPDATNTPSDPTDATNTPLSIPSTHYSPYHPTPDLALADHLPNYIEDLIAYEAFQTLLALSQRFDGQAVINAFELLKEINPDNDYYLDVEAGRADDL